MATRTGGGTTNYRHAKGPLSLSACPFCGNQNMDEDEGVFRSGPRDATSPFHDVACGDPGCAARITGDSRENAVARWNRRASYKRKDGDGYGTIVQMNKLAAIERTRREAYIAGWIVASKWAKRDDLLADIDSPAWTKDRDEALEIQFAKAAVCDVERHRSDPVHDFDVNNDGSIASGVEHALKAATSAPREFDPAQAERDLTRAGFKACKTCGNELTDKTWEAVHDSLEEIHMRLESIRGHFANHLNAQKDSSHG